MISPTIPPEGRALLEAISGTESAGSYNVIYGGNKFSDYGDHPRKPVLITSGPNKGKYSTAAGKYQFIAPTWDAAQKALNLPDFSPESQDKAAWWLAQDDYRRRTGNDLTTALRSGDPATISGVGRALAPTWTSLPSGIEQGQNGSQFLTAYVKGVQDQGEGQVASELSTTSSASQTAARTNRWFDRPTPAPMAQGVAARTNAMFSQMGQPANTAGASQKLLPVVGPTGGPTLDGSKSLIPSLDQIGTMPLFSQLTDLFGGSSSDKSSSNTGVVRTQAQAGQVAMPAGVRPRVASTTPGNRSFLPAGQQSYAGQEGYTTQRILNPAYNLALEKQRKQIPLGDVFHGASRDSMAQAAQGRNMASMLPQQWLTVRKPVAAPRVAPQPRPAASRPAGAYGGSSSGGSSSPDMSTVAGRTQVIDGALKGIFNGGSSDPLRYDPDTADWVRR